MKPSISTAILLIVVSLAHATDEHVDFAKDVLPILSNKCFVCHGPDTQDDNELRLDTFEGATQDRGGYKAINPDAPERSRLIQRIHSADDPMPPADAEKQLTTAERDVLRRWVRQGGQYARHWAFEPPVVKQPIAPQKAIDTFIHRQLAQQNVDFSPAAEKSVLARRVSLVLTGLPPQPTELQTYLADTRPDSYERYVDKLLNDERYGEHQARYWLDAVRYGDTHGLHLDNKRGIYPYRDWVVKAFNDNLPLNDFITWQLAGDLLPNPTLEQLVATGYVRLNPSTGEGGAISAEFQMKNNFDRVETLGTVFLGLSLTCARCHTHKYDPIPQTEYYRLLAFFNSTAEPAMDRNKYEYGPTVKVPRDQSGWKALEQIRQQREQISKQPNAKQSAALSALSKSEAELIKTFTTSLIAKDLPTPRKTHVLMRGEYNQPIGEPVQPGTLSLAPNALAADTKIHSDRRGLARWLTNPNHPLVRRVLVNRLWQRTFGYGLVRTPEDFGLQGEHPTHPELLDWLAVNFTTYKSMLRLMVTSRTFRQTSKWRTDFDDPENRFFARASSYRLDAEVLRDIGLWSSQLLDPHMGGEGVKPHQPVGMWKALAHPASNTKRYELDSDSRQYRRSLYVYWKRTSPHPMMTLFDAPDRESSCVRRSRTNTSLQSLGLLNETQRIEMARSLAQRLLKEADRQASRIDLLFQLLASRDAQHVEQAALGQLIEQLTNRYTANPDDAKNLLATGESRPDPSLDAIQLAVWTQVAITTLASDAAILLY